MRKKINKEKINKNSFKERIREKVCGATLNYKFTFGKYQGHTCRQVCECDPEYIRWCMVKKILDFEKEVIDYMIKCKKANKYKEEEYQRRAEETSRKRAEQFCRSAATDAQVKIVSPAEQWDHLPDKQKYGKVLGIEGGTQINKQAIRDLYKKRMLEYHPDKCERLGSEVKKLSHEMTIRIQEAYKYFQRAYGI